MQQQPCQPSKHTLPVLLALLLACCCCQLAALTLGMTTLPDPEVSDEVSGFSKNTTAPRSSRPFSTAFTRSFLSSALTPAIGTASRASAIAIPELI